MSDDPLLDPRTLASLRALSGPDDPDLHVRLARRYVDVSRRTLVTLRESGASGDCGALADAAHFLKGGSGDVGATRLIALCDRVEHAAIAGEVDQPGIAAVEAEFELVASALEAEFGS